VTRRFSKSKFALTGGITALLLGLWTIPALASSGFTTHRSEVTAELPSPEIPRPSLNIKLVDHGLIEAAADMKAPAAEPADEEVPAPALAKVKTTSSTEEVEEDVADENVAIPVSDPPGTALRLPGVSEKDQPRFRRQMNRTDI
jgi:hypothetical protein